jgi:hypothetical protein
MMAMTTNISTSVNARGRFGVALLIERSIPLNAENSNKQLVQILQAVQPDGALRSTASIGRNIFCRGGIVTYISDGRRQQLFTAKTFHTFSLKRVAAAAASCGSRSQSKPT